MEYRSDRRARWVTLDWGMGWSVSADTVITVGPEPPAWENPPTVQSPIEAMHQAMHAGGGCTEGVRCPKAMQARVALRAFREWQEKQSESYWEHKYMKPLRRRVAQGDYSGAASIVASAEADGAPEYILDRMRPLACQAPQGR